MHLDEKGSRMEPNSLSCCESDTNCIGVSRFQLNIVVSELRFIEPWYTSCTHFSIRVLAMVYC